MTTTLYGAAATGVSLAEALAAAGLDGACALLTTPSAYRIATVADGACVTADGPVDLAAAYEARAFTPDAELRWADPGYAVVLTEDAALLPASFPERIDPLPAVAVLNADYLLWGEVRGTAPGWATLRSSRIGALTVPLADPPADRSRIRLAAREYVVAEPEHGNAYVAEERLLRFEPHTDEKKGTTR